MPFQIFEYELAGAYNEEFYSAYSGYYFINFGMGYWKVNVLVVVKNKLLFLNMIVC